MVDLNKWTSAELNSAEQDLLEKRKRRQEIPKEISSKEQEIQQLKQTVAEYKNAVAKLEQETGRLQNQVNHLNSSYQRTFQYTGDEYTRAMDAQRAQIQAQIRGVQQRLSENNKQQKIYKSGIASANEKIRVLELEISSLKTEDQNIVDKCKEYITTFHDVADSAGKAAQSHQGASNKFGAAAGATRFGNNAIQAGKNSADNNVKKYKDIQQIALMLERLALEIIDAGSNGANAGGSASGYNQQLQNVMGMGYANDPTAITSSSGSFATNSDGTTNFSSVSFLGEVPIDPHHVSAEELDNWAGCEKYGLSADEFRQFRKESGVVWQIEGNNAYLVYKDHTKQGSADGYTLDDWDGTPPNVKQLVKR